MNYRFLDQARTEYYEAITYYEDKSVGFAVLTISHTASYTRLFPARRAKTS